MKTLLFSGVRFIRRAIICALCFRPCPCAWIQRKVWKLSFDRESRNKCSRDIVYLVVSTMKYVYFMCVCVSFIHWNCSYRDIRWATVCADIIAVSHTHTIYMHICSYYAARVSGLAAYLYIYICMPANGKEKNEKTSIGVRINQWWMDERFVQKKMICMCEIEFNCDKAFARVESGQRHKESNTWKS